MIRLTTDQFTTFKKFAHRLKIIDVRHRIFTIIGEEEETITFRES